MVSVLIPFFNGEKFIAETIESVLAQTYTAWELLLLDDGSTDGSTAIARKYAEKYSNKIKYLEHEGHGNKGVCVTRNLGVRKARGGYIALLDADDVWYPSKLADQVKIMEENPQAGMVCGAVLNWRNWDEKNERKDEIRPTGSKQNSLIMPPKLCEDLYPLGLGMAPSPSDLMIKKEVLEKIKGFEEVFTQEYQLFEDQSFLSKIYLSCPVYISDKTWTKYRRHEDQCVAVANKTGRFQKIRKFYFQWFKNHLIENGYKDTLVWKLAKKQLFPYEHPVVYQCQQTMAAVFKDIKMQFKKGIFKYG